MTEQETVEKIQEEIDNTIPVDFSSNEGGEFDHVIIPTFGAFIVVVIILCYYL